MKRFILCFSFFVLIPATAVGVQVATQGKPLGTQENRITESKGSLRAENCGFRGKAGAIPELIRSAFRN
jgi:hypothetical protein